MITMHGISTQWSCFQADPTTQIYRDQRFVEPIFLLPEEESAVSLDMVAIRAHALRYI